MSDITLTNKQNDGLKLAVKRFKDHEKYTCISGFAGTGKSTLVQFIIQELKLNDDEIAYCAYTGKAAMVLKQKGCPGATTAHQLVYYNKELPDGTFVHTPLRAPENPKLKLVVVDEVSMLEREMWDILMSWDVYVIALGDPYQLPPIHEENGVLNHPHIFLDEIMRQAQESEIIRLSMDIRDGKPLRYFKGKDVRVVPKNSIGDNLLVTADQVLCGKNITRYELNKRIRQAIWKEKFSNEPLNGDKVICLKNYWNYGNLTNGTIGTINNVFIRDSELFKPKMIASFHADTNDDFYCLHMDHKIFTEGKPTVNQDNWMMYQKHERPLEFDFAFAVTTHKYQGSEAPKIVVFDEWLGGREMHQRWLYTACTRASEKLVIAL